MVTSKRVINEVGYGAGLWAEYRQGYTACAFHDIEGARYVITYHKGEMPAFDADAFNGLEALEAKMRELQPDLRKWRTLES